MLQQLLLKIETLRNELGKELEKDYLKLDQGKILSLSTQLDELILEYIKNV